MRPAILVLALLSVFLGCSDRPDPGWVFVMTTAEGMGVRVVDMRGDEVTYTVGGVVVVNQAQVEEWAAKAIATPAFREDFVRTYSTRMTEVFARGDVLDIEPFTPAQSGSETRDPQAGRSIIRRDGDGADMALQLVRSGFAVVDPSCRFGGRDEYRQRLLLAEVRARAEKAGGWRVFPEQLAALGQTGAK